MGNKGYSFILLFFLFVSACSEQPSHSAYKTEADALCDAFNPATWEVDFEKLSPSQKAEMLVEKIQSAIHSDKMKEIVQALSHDRSKSAYANYAKSVSALTGESYSCDAMKDYFSVSFN